MNIENTHRQIRALQGKRSRGPAKIPDSPMSHPWLLERDDAERRCSPSEAAALPELVVGFVVWPDFTLLALAGFIDALRLAADVGDRSHQILCRWTLMSPDSAPLRSSCGIEIAADAHLRDPRSFDYIVVIGGLIRSFPSVRTELKSYLRAAAAAEVPLVGVCTGAVVLAECGLMTNRRCCVASYHHGDLVSRAPDAIPVSAELFVDDGDRITCAGGTAAIDLATYLVQRHCGKDRAVKLVHAMLLHQMRAPASAQRQLGIDDRQVTDLRIARALLLMEQHFHKKLSISELARRLDMNQRQLERLFASAFGDSPSHIYRLMRVRHGRWLLENSQLPLTKIAFECGFADSSHFIRCFVEELKCTPGEFRRQVTSAQIKRRRANHTATAVSD